MRREHIHMGPKMTGLRSSDSIQFTSVTTHRYRYSMKRITLSLHLYTIGVAMHKWQTNMSLWQVGTRSESGDDDGHCLQPVGHHHRQPNPDIVTLKAWERSCEGHLSMESRVSIHACICISLHVFSAGRCCNGFSEASAKEEMRKQCYTKTVLSSEQKRAGATRQRTQNQKIDDRLFEE